MFTREYYIKFLTLTEDFITTVNVIFPLGMTWFPWKNTISFSVKKITVTNTSDKKETEITNDYFCLHPWHGTTEVVLASSSLLNIMN